MFRTGLTWILLACAFVLALAFLVLPARSHSWYEVGRCSDKDCKPVAEGHVVERADGVHVKGHGILSRTDTRLRWSRDDNDHVCEQPAGKLLCVYRKPNGM